MNCYYCPNYKTDYGPAKSSYCRAFQAKLSDEENPDGAKEFYKYYNMGGESTNVCPHGSHSKDYD